jgi:hypothetical protein
LAVPDLSAQPGAASQRAKIDSQEWPCYLVRAAFALGMHASAIYVWCFFHGFALLAAIFLAGDHTAANRMSAFLGICHWCLHSE